MPLLENRENSLINAVGILWKIMTSALAVPVRFASAHRSGARPMEPCIAALFRTASFSFVSNAHVCRCGSDQDRDMMF